MFWKIFRKRNPRYFISIGAGKNQVPLIIEAKRAGFRVIGVDSNYSAPGFNISMKQYQR